MGKIVKRIIRIVVTIAAIIVAIRFVLAVLEKIKPVSKDKYIEVYRDRVVD